MKRPLQEIPHSKTNNVKKKNSSTNTDDCFLWSDGVWEEFERKLNNNSTSKETTYYHDVDFEKSAPPALNASLCQVPTGSNQIMVVHKKQQYQRPIHRMLLQLQRRRDDLPLLNKKQQASHLCMDTVNKDGKGLKHCVNVHHMVVEDDKTNKSRQRCPGWIWIRKYQENPGGYWYPSCIHSPPCLRYQEKSIVPTYFQ